MSELISWQKAWVNERMERKAIKPEELCNFGVKPLDDAIPFIMKNDLIVIGADAGAGKSELGVSIAIHNAKKKRNVAMFYLEGGDKEAIGRIKYRIFAKKLAERGEYIDYTEWKCNQLVLDDLESEAMEQMNKDIQDNLWLYEITDEFGIKNLLSSLYGFHSLEQRIKMKKMFNLDLIIVDHLQYFDLGEKETEIIGITKILKELKTIADQYRIPVILISHLRKKNKDRGLPDQEDFYGSSNVPKIATSAIVICSDTSKQDYSDGIYPTFFRFVKSRTGLRAQYVLKSNFNIKLREYDDTYEMFYVNQHNQPSKESIEFKKLPKWAKKGVLDKSITLTDTYLTKQIRDKEWEE